MKANSRAVFFFFLCLLVFSGAAFCDDFGNPKNIVPKGPLQGKNMFIPFLIHYNFPSLPAVSGEQFDLQYHASLYYIQDARFEWNTNLPTSKTDPVRYYEKANINRDYESAVIELGAYYNIFKELQVGMDMRVISYYGGFLDEFVEWVHAALGAPGGDREYFLQDQVYVNISNDNGIPLFLDKETTSFGDIDIWTKWTFFENRFLSLAALGAVKLPTGSLKALSGSNFPDTGIGILADIRTTWFLTFYGQAGLVVPFNVKSHPMFNGMVGAEIHPFKIISFNVQMNIKSSPISGGTLGWSWNETYGTDIEQNSMPQTNLLVGLIVQYKKFKWQVYFEEDLITNQGTDFTVNILFSHLLNLRP